MVCYWMTTQGGRTEHEINPFKQRSVGPAYPTGRHEDPSPPFETASFQGCWALPETTSPRAFQLKGKSASKSRHFGGTKGEIENPKSLPLFHLPFDPHSTIVIDGRWSKVVPYVQGSTISTLKSPLKLQCLRRRWGFQSFIHEGKLPPYFIILRKHIQNEKKEEK